MHYRLLEGGVLTCSTVFIWGWTSADVNLDRKPCDLSTSESVAAASKHTCIQKSSFLGNGVIPENLFHLRWSVDRINRPVQELEQVYESLLKQAQGTAQRDRLPEAISTLGGIPKNSRHYPLAQQLQNDWSQELLQRARQHYQQANLTAGLKLLNTIPPTCQHYSQAQKLSAQWHKQAQLISQILFARKTGNWSQVIQKLKLLEGKPLYQSSLVQQILQDATAKQFELDSTLINVAVSIGKESPSAVRRPQLNGQVPLAIAPIPPQKELEIATEQALEWAKPKHLNAIRAKRPKPVATSQPSLMDRNPSPKPIFPYQLPNPMATKRDTSTTITPQSKPTNESSETKPKTDDGRIIP